MLCSGGLPPDPGVQNKFPVIHNIVAIQQPEIHDDDHDHKKNTRINLSGLYLSGYIISPRRLSVSHYQ